MSSNSVDKYDPYFNTFASVFSMAKMGVCSEYALKLKKSNGRCFMVDHLDDHKPWLASYLFTGLSNQVAKAFRGHARSAEGDSKRDLLKYEELFFVFRAIVQRHSPDKDTDVLMKKIWKYVFLGWSKCMETCQHEASVGYADLKPEFLKIRGIIETYRDSSLIAESLSKAGGESDQERFKFDQIHWEVWKDRLKPFVELLEKIEQMKEPSQLIKDYDVRLKETQDDLEERVNDMMDKMRTVLPKSALGQGAAAAVGADAGQPALEISPAGATAEVKDEPTRGEEAAAAEAETRQPIQENDQAGKSNAAKQQGGKGRRG